MLIPGDATDFKIARMFGERRAQVAAVLFHRVGWLVAPSHKSDDSLHAHFSTRKLPITSASIPELKNVRKASVGVCTMASPRRLKDVFMTTGTPVILPNSSIRR